VTSEDSTRTGHDLDEANGKVPNKLHDGERRVLSTHSMSTPRRKRKRVVTTTPPCKRQCVRAASTTLRHVPMLGTPPVSGLSEEPISNNGLDLVNESRLGIKSNAVEEKIALVDGTATPDRDASLEVPNIMASRNSERLQEVRLENTSGCGLLLEKRMVKKMRRTDRGFRKREVLIGRMKSDEFAPGSVADKVMATLLAKLAQKSPFKI
jgi:hypothetical protein